MKYQSNARWPTSLEFLYEDRVSTDTHCTRESAQVVCDMLEEDGYGGQGKIFPEETWVTAIPDR